MINETLYHKTVNILVEAYFNDTLVHGNCHACAVGNLVATNMGLTYRNTCTNMKKEWVERPMSSWDNVFYTCDGGEQFIRDNNYEGPAKQEIDSTGYTWQELAKIEYAFEKAPYGNNDDEWMFNGLMAVIEVLDQIHQNTDTEITSKTKQRFEKIH